MAQPAESGSFVDLTFGDGNSYRFHSLWMRDACQDENHLCKDAGERILSVTTAMALTQSELALDNLVAESVTVSPNGEEVVVKWNDSSVQESRFESHFLRAYADVVAKPLSSATPSKVRDLTWIFSRPDAWLNSILFAGNG